MEKMPYQPSLDSAPMARPWIASDRLREEIRAGTFRAPKPEIQPPVLTFRVFAEIWRERRGNQLVRPRDNDYRLRKINDFIPPGGQGATFGDNTLERIKTDDIDAFREARKAAGLSACTVNHDLKLLRKMFNWAVRKGYLERTPFKIGTEPAISLDKEIPRDRRFQDDDDEQKLLDAANPYLRAVIIGLLDTACRLGELLSLQWRDVNLERRELMIQAAKAKTRTARIVPISSRLLATLEIRKFDPAGRPLGPDAYVFGTALGDRVKSVRAAWEEARNKAGFERPADSGSSPRGGFTVRRSRRVDRLRKQAPRPCQPEHDHPLSQCPATRPPSRDAEAGGVPKQARFGCTNVAQRCRRCTSRCARPQRLTFR